MRNMPNMNNLKKTLRLIVGVLRAPLDAVLVLAGLASYYAGMGMTQGRPPGRSAAALPDQRHFHAKPGAALRVCCGLRARHRWSAACWANFRRPSSRNMPMPYGKTVTAFSKSAFLTPWWMSWSALPQGAQPWCMASASMLGTCTCSMQRPRWEEKYSIAEAEIVASPAMQKLMGCFLSGGRGEHTCVPIP